MKRGVRIATGLLLIPLFSAVVFVALMIMFVLVRYGIASQGDPAAFEEYLRHGLDRFEMRPDGSFVLHRAPHPVATSLAMFVVSWAVAIGLGYVLALLRRRGVLT